MLPDPIFLLEYYCQKIIQRYQIMQPAQYTVYATIFVSEPVLQQGPHQKTTPFVSYLITGKDPHGEFRIRRRFRQFYQLRQKLVQRFIGIYVPPIPSKKVSKNTEQRIVEQRRRFFNYFCLKIAARPYLFSSDIFQTFIRGDPDFQRAAKFLSRNEFGLIANIYNQEFGPATEGANSAKIISEIEAEGQALKIVEKKLTEIREQIRQIVQIKRAFITQYAKCYSQILPRFQQTFLSKHSLQSDKSLYLNNQAFKERLSEYVHFSSVNPLTDYIESITYDIRQARALIEAIETRRTFKDKRANFQMAHRQSKEQLERLQNGRMSIKSLFTAGTKEAQIKELQTYIPQYQSCESFLAVCLPLSALAIRKDVQLFKKSTLQLISQKQMRILHLYGQMFLEIQPKSLSKPILPPQIQNVRKDMKEQQHQHQSVS